MAQYPVANPDDAAWTKHQYIWQFGAYGGTHVVSYGDSFDDGLEEAMDWLADNAPGIFTIVDYAEAAEDLGLDVDDEAHWEAIADRAEADMLVVGHTTYPNLPGTPAIPSWEVSVQERPNRRR